MTLIVALKYKEGVALAAERQITYDGTAIRTDVEKIKTVAFQNFSAMVGIVHDIDNGFRFVNMLKQVAILSSPTSPEEVGSIVEKTMFSMRDLIGQSYPDDKRVLNQIITDENINFSITIAFYLNHQAHIINIGLLKPRYCLSEGIRETDGCGATLADFLITEYYTPGMDLEYTILVAAYAIWVVSQYDSMCRGPITIGLATGPGGLNSDGKPRVVMFSKERVADFIRIAEQVYSSSRETRREVIRSEFEKRKAESLRLIDEQEEIWASSSEGQNAPEYQSDPLDVIPPKMTQSEWEERME